MKKLNITKERFEKSRYFQKKYGKLEYVSESGKVFKTSKGKILKFNEGAYHDKTHLNIRDYDKLPDEEKDNYVEPMFGIGMVVNLSDEFYKYADMYGCEEPKTGWHIKDVEYSKIRKIWEYYIVNDDSPYHADKGFWAEEDEICDEYDESTKKFGKKFKESTKKFNERTDIENEDEVWNKWERMSDEITSALNIEQVAKSVAKKYFPRKANEIANWINENIELICTDGYCEDWTDLNSCLRVFIRETDSQLSDLT